MRMRLSTNPAASAIASDFIGLAETYLQVSSTSCFCVVDRLSPLALIQSAVWVPAELSLSAASCASVAYLSIAGFASGPLYGWGGQALAFPIGAGFMAAVALAAWIIGRKAPVIVRSGASGGPSPGPSGAGNVEVSSRG